MLEHVAEIMLTLFDIDGINLDSVLSFLIQKKLLLLLFLGHIDIHEFSYDFLIYDERMEVRKIKRNILVSRVYFGYRRRRQRRTVVNIKCQTNANLNYYINYYSFV